MKKLFIVLGFLALPVILFAQDAAPGALLPDIDPQDIEIRGDFVARFPGIMRQPILGFSPRPRVFQIDPNRMPFTESPEQVVASLPLSDLERPQPPEYLYYRKPVKFNLWSTTGIGNYMAPEADIYLGVPIGIRTKITGRFNTISSGSYLEDDDQTSSFRNLDGGINVIHYSGKRNRWDFGLTGRSDRNHLPNSQFTPTPVSSAAVLLSPDNNMASIGSSLGYRYDKNQYDFWDIGIEANLFGADVATVSFTPGETIRHEVSETRFGGTIRKDMTTNRPGNTLSFQLGGQYASYDLDGVSDTWYVGNAGVLYNTRFGYRLKTSIGGRFFYASDHLKAYQVIAYPEVSMTYNLTPDFTIRGDIKGFVNNQGLQGLNKANRRLFYYNHPENERGIQVKGTAEYNVIQGLRTQSGLSYTRYTRHAYYHLDSQPVEPFTRPSFGLHSNDLMTFSYLDGANILKWDASVWYDLMPSVLTAYAGLYVQWHGDNNGNEIPFRENIGFSAGGTYSFTQRSRLQLWADYTGSRHVGTARDDAAGYVLLNAKFDFFASKEIGAYLKITNILDQSYSRWVGYDELPTQIYGGIMIKI